MTIVLIALVVALAALVVALAVRQRPRVDRPFLSPKRGARRILFPFVAQALSPRVLDAALRLASAEEATLVPVFLARVPLRLPLDAPLPQQSGIALPLQEAIEHRAMAFGITVDARIERGRTYRHALRQTIAGEHFDRIVVAAAAHGSRGFAPDDVAWLLENAPGEIVVLRPDADEQIGPRPPAQRRPLMSGRGRRRNGARPTGPRARVQRDDRDGAEAARPAGAREHKHA